MKSKYDDYNCLLQLCNEKGGWLAEIKTADEQAALDSILDSQAQAEYWIGLTDMAEKGKWVWQHSNQTLGP